MSIFIDKYNTKGHADLQQRFTIITINVWKKDKILFYNNNNYQYYPFDMLFVRCWTFSGHVLKMSNIIKINKKWNPTGTTLSFLKHAQIRRYT